MENYQTFIKALNYDTSLSREQLSEQITEVAFNTSSLLQEMGYVQADNPSYRNVYVTHPTTSDVNEGDDIPFSTVQSYSVTETDFVKVASRIELSNEVLKFSKFDIEGNTAQLVGVVMADQLAQKAVADISARFVDIADQQEEVLRLKSGVSGAWGADIQSTYEFLASAIKEIPDAYDSNSKLFCSKNNFVDFAASVTTEGEQVWLIQGGKLLGRYDVVICDQLPDGVMYFGDMSSFMDVVGLFGRQTVDNHNKPDVLAITESNKFSYVVKDNRALVAMTQEV